ncbi:glycosyltransferase family 4 protein [Thalassospira sp.]|uniref:glycosyltransferase family 4 protein n=1 Tax=Thalassospira sp. TaxID=1912094 RepID=UPI00312037F8
MTKRNRLVAMVQLPPPMHGAAKMNRHAIDALSEKFDTHVIEMRFANKLSDISRPTAAKILRALWLAIRLVFALPGRDALYICFAPTGGAYYRDCLYVLLARLFGVPAIIHLHGRGLCTMRQTAGSAWFQKRVFSGQTAILLGETLRSEIAGLDCRSVIIANCLDDDAFAGPPGPDWCPASPVRILWLSNLFRAKGIETLIAACALLGKRGVPFNLTIAGAPGDMTVAELDTLLASCGIRTFSNYVGPIAPNARTALYHNSDLFVLPTNYANEAQPLVVIEAMAAGIPVITSDIATLPEFVIPGQTGWLCPSGDPDLLARAIIDVPRDPARTDMIRRNAWTLCQNRFHRARFAEQIQMTVMDVLQNTLPITGATHQNAGNPNPDDRK